MKAAHRISGGYSRTSLDPKGGFHTLEEFVGAVMVAGSRVRQGAVDQRLVFGAQAPSTSGSEQTGSDGGYLVPMSFAAEIFRISLDEGSLLPLTSELPVTGNSISFPVDETTPWGNTGVRMLWSHELEAATQSKLSVGGRTLKLRKMIGLVPLTDELMSDSTAAAAFASSQLGQALAWKINSAIVNGTGGKEPLGYRKHSSLLLSQTKETSQTADTITALNVSKMFGRLPATSMRSPSLRWLINPDALNQVMYLTIEGQPVWTPPQGGSDAAPAGYLLGRPIVVTDLCETLGDAGDIQLADFRQYVTISKGPEYAESMHLFFDYGLQALRLTFRMDGQPWLSAPISPANGSMTRGPFVQLEARA